MHPHIYKNTLLYLFVVLSHFCSFVCIHSDRQNVNIPTDIYSDEMIQRGRETGITVSVNFHIKIHKSTHSTVVSLCWHYVDTWLEKDHKSSINLFVKVEQAPIHIDGFGGHSMTSSVLNENQCKHTANRCHHKLKAKTQRRRERGGVWRIWRWWYWESETVRW